MFVETDEHRDRLTRNALCTCDDGHIVVAGHNVDSGIIDSGCAPAGGSSQAVGCVEGGYDHDHGRRTENGCNLMSGCNAGSSLAGRLIAVLHGSTASRGMVLFTELHDKVDCFACSVMWRGAWEPLGEAAFLSATCSGILIGGACWERFCLQHGVQPDGQPVSDSTNRGGCDTLDQSVLQPSGCDQVPCCLSMHREHTAVKGTNFAKDCHAHDFEFQLQAKCFGIVGASEFRHVMLPPGHDTLDPGGFRALEGVLRAKLRDGRSF